MSEPKAVAKKLEKIVPGVYRYKVMDDRIEAESDAYALVEKGRAVLIDPLPLAESTLKRLGRVEAIVLSASCHQRSAWRFRRKLGTKVYAPSGAENLEEEPDATYRPASRLPGGLGAIHAPGPTDAHYAFRTARGKGVVFCGDLLKNLPGEGLSFISSEYQDDPAKTRRSVRKLLDLRFRVLCLSHGAPVLSGVRRALLDLLRKDHAG